MKHFIASRAKAVAVALFACGSFTSGIQAATIFWDANSGVDNNWSRAANWSTDQATSIDPANAPTGSGDNVRLNYNAYVQNYNVNVDGPRTIGWFLFQALGSTASNYTISGSAITITGLSTNTVGTLKTDLLQQQVLKTTTINNDLIFSNAANDQTIGLGSGSKFIFGGSITSARPNLFVAGRANLNNRTQEIEILTSGNLASSVITFESQETATTLTGSKYFLTLDDNTSIADTSSLVLLDNGQNIATPYPVTVKLPFTGAPEIVASLTINGVVQAGNGTTYGATGSGATVIDDVHFSGTGMLQVGVEVPEPTCCAAFGVLAALLFPRRRPEVR